MELRDMIYHYALAPEARCVGYDTLGSLSPPALACVNRMIRTETLPIFYRKNNFSLRSTDTRGPRHRTNKLLTADGRLKRPYPAPRFVIYSGPLSRDIRRMRKQRMEQECWPQSTLGAEWIPIDHWRKYAEMFTCFEQTDGLQYIATLEAYYYEPSWPYKLGCRVNGHVSSNSSSRSRRSAFWIEIRTMGEGDISWQDQGAVTHAVDHTVNTICCDQRCIAYSDFKNQGFSQRLVDTICLVTKRLEAVQKVEIIWNCFCTQILVGTHYRLDTGESSDNE